MNIKISFLLFVMTLGFQIAAAQQQSGSKMIIDKKLADFGEVPADSCVRTAVFTFTNAGDEDLIILTPRTTCKCTTAEFSSRVIKPGKSGTVKVTWDGTNKSFGHFSQNVDFSTNGKPEYVRLTVEGTKVKASSD